MSGRAAWGAGARMVSIRRRALDLSGSFDAESGASNVCPDVASQKASGQRPEGCLTRRGFTEALTPTK